MGNPIKKWYRMLRQRRFSARVRRQAQSCGEGLRVNHKSSVSSKTVLGNNVNFNGMVIGGRATVRIGDNFHSGVGCRMLTSFHNYDSGDAIPYDSTYVSKEITIGDNVWLGDHVIVLGGVIIGEGAVIQAGSVVCKSVPACAVAGGHPAVPFRFRDMEHYNACKAAGKFH